MKFVEITEKKWFRVAWFIFMLVLVVTNTFVKVTHAGCGWTDGPAEYQAVNLGLAFAAAGGLAALFFPPLAVGAVVLGGLAGAYKCVLMMSGC